MQVTFTDPNRARYFRHVDPDMMSRRHVLSVFDHPNLVKPPEKGKIPTLSLAPEVWMWLRQNFEESVVDIYMAESHVRLDFETSEQATLFSLFVIH